MIGKELKFLVDRLLRYNPYFYKKLKSVQEMEEWDEKRSFEYQNKKFLQLLREAYHHSPFYKNYYNEYGIDISSIKSIDDVHLLPLLKKEHLRDHYRNIFIGSRLNQISSYTSGTSGNPTLVYRDYQSILEEAAYLWAHRISYGHFPGMKTLILRGNLKSNRFKFYNRYTNTLELSSYKMSEENANAYIDAIRKFKPNAVFAYPSAIDTLANLFGSKHTSFRIPLVFTSSESLYTHQRNKVVDTFGCQLVDWYGNAERTIAIRQRKDDLYEDLPTYSVNRYFKDNVVTTSLINHSFPLINYVVNDVIHLEGSRTASGKTIVKKIQGRDDDLLLLPDGTRLGMIWGAVDRIPNLLYAQFVQDDLYSFTINIVGTHSFSWSDERLLEEKVKSYVGENAEFTINRVNKQDIVLSKAGKYKLVINNYLKKSQHQDLIPA